MKKTRSRFYFMLYVYDVESRIVIATISSPIEKKCLDAFEDANFDVENVGCTFEPRFESKDGLVMGKDCQALYVG